MYEVPLNKTDDMPSMIWTEHQPPLGAVDQIPVMTLHREPNIFSDDDFTTKNRDTISVIPLMPCLNLRNQPLDAIGRSCA